MRPPGRNEGRRLKPPRREGVIGSLRFLAEHRSSLLCVRFDYARLVSFSFFTEHRQVYCKKWLYWSFFESFRLRLMFVNSFSFSTPSLQVPLMTAIIELRIEPAKVVITRLHTEQGKATGVLKFCSRIQLIRSARVM